MFRLIQFKRSNNVAFIPSSGVFVVAGAQDGDFVVAEGRVVALSIRQKRLPLSDLNYSKFISLSCSEHAWALVCVLVVLYQRL